MKKVLLSLLCLMATISAFAQEEIIFKDGDFYYKVVGEDCGVTTNDDKPYSGEVAVPETAKHAGKTYQVTQVLESAFANCSGLKKVILPKTITDISANAFKACNNITEIRCYNEEVAPNANTYAFDGMNPNCVIKVRKNAYNSFIYNSVWKKFNIMLMAVALIDKEEYAETNKYLYEEVTYTRTFNNTAVQPLYVPFEMPYEVWDEQGLEVFEISSFMDVQNDAKEELALVKMNNGSVVMPNKPYFVRALEEGEKTIALENTYLHPAEVKSITRNFNGTTWVFEGTYKKIKNLVKNEYYVMSNGYICIADNNSVELGGYRWYLYDKDFNEPYAVNPTYSTKHAPARFAIRIVDEGTTGIDNINANQRNDNKVYTIDGRLMDSNALPRGMYIKNGKKFLVK